MFEIDEVKIKKIAEEFSIEEETVALLAKEYETIQKGMKKQYLAHIIRTMEIQLQDITKNPMFKITVKPLPLTEGNMSARAQYQPGRFFSIGYPENMDDIQLRVCLAHELGHLYLVEYINNLSKEVRVDEKTNIEPLSTVFGIFAILDKNNFYSTLPERKLLHKTWESILEDFKLLANRNKKIYNIS